MPKRPNSDEDSPQPLKVQLNSKQKPRKIRSVSSERTLQILFSGASKYLETNGMKNSVSRDVCFRCGTSLSNLNSCSYCEKNTCDQCTNVCYKCDKSYCPNCSYLTYDHNGSICYSC